ncbi:hypothetical protein M7I_2482 [Glarea lozoyensis 74030]|uniref:Uncharacterized protein n=1 Tax=Glarea lozoyensis (strain ATCC 74030 / MF5533) TaxID=1104152 RepID=H0EIW4_GLAL7|nr:hypothetical protein M7I_2482 [Glarea lozoyensis 74030]
MAINQADAMDRIPGGQLLEFLRPNRTAAEVEMDDEPVEDLFPPGIFEPPQDENEMFEYSDENESYDDGIAPSMLQLKQHAHSLVALIKNISVSSRGGVIDNVNSGEPNLEPLQFIDGETFDFLNDLSTPYTGPKDPASKVHHEMPLTALLNVLEEHNIPLEGQEPRPTYKVRNICPLHHVEDHPHPPTSQPLPYATHQALISHANEILELLDHEYMAKGGLLAVLPLKEDKEEREKTGSTLLGQLMLYVNRLVQRLHDLERLYANSMDVLAGEAAIPAQTLSALGPSGRRGREIVYPQDRFVLVNSGEDVWNHLDTEFSRRERVEERVMEQYKELGLTGEKLWENDGEKEMSRGITALDVTTRYFRLRNDPLKTIFIIPAWQQHPGTKVTRDLEAVPTVVSVVKPVWPERASMYEQKHRQEIEDYKRLKGEFYSLRNKVKILSQSNTVLESQFELKNGEIRTLKKKIEELKAITDGDESDLAKSKAEQIQALGLLHAKKEDADRALQESEALRTEAVEEKRKAVIEREKAEQINREESLAYSRRRAALEEEFSKKLQALQQRDIENGEAAVELDKKVKARWRKQIVETQIVFEELKAKQIEIGKGKIGDQSVKLGTTRGTKIAVEEGLLNTMVPREDSKMVDDSVLAEP